MVALSNATKVWSESSTMYITLFLMIVARPSVSTNRPLPPCTYNFCEGDVVFADMSWSTSSTYTPADAAEASRELAKPRMKIVAIRFMKPLLDQRGGTLAPGLPR